MLTLEENALFTQIGPGTKMGEVLRRYWHPVSASEWVTIQMRALPTDFAIRRASGRSSAGCRLASGSLSAISEGNR